MPRRILAIVTVLAALAVATPASAHHLPPSPIEATRITATTTTFAAAPDGCMTDGVTTVSHVGPVDSVEMIFDSIRLNETLGTVLVNGDFAAGSVGGSPFSIFADIPPTISIPELSCVDGAFSIPLDAGALYIGYRITNGTWYWFEGRLSMHVETSGTTVTMLIGLDAEVVPDITVEDVVSEVFGDSGEAKAWIKRAASIELSDGISRERRVEAATIQLNALASAGRIAQDDADAIVKALR